MLPFLRRIRQSLFATGAARKPTSAVRRYLLYAIGEVLLVMIGILLALQVNNWNEERKARNLEHQALINLKEEFQKNREDLQDHINWKKDIQQQWVSFLDSITNPALISEGRIIKRPIASFVFYNISNSVLNSLLVTGNIDNIQNDSLKYLLTTWEDVVKDYNQFQEMHSNFANNQFFTYEWSLFPTENSRRYGYEYSFPGNIDKSILYNKAYNQMEYQNRLLQNFYWINIQLERITEVEEKMEKIIQLLEDEISLFLD